MRGQLLGLVALLAVSVSTGIAGCGGADAENNQAGEDAADNRREPEQPQGDEAYKERVRAWLRENLDSGRWEEVRWWSPRPLVKDHEATIARMKKALENYEANLPLRQQNGDPEKIAMLLEVKKQQFEEAQNHQPIKAARLKYRTANEKGVIELFDDVFLFLEDGQIEKVPASPYFATGDFEED